MIKCSIVLLLHGNIKLFNNDETINEINRTKEQYNLNNILIKLFKIS